MGCYETLRGSMRLAATVIVCGALSTGSAGETSATKPNILWITFEDHGVELPIYGDNHAHMPNLTKLAEGGCVFTRAFSTSPVCAPSRSTIITGVYAATLGTHNMRTEVPLPPGIKTFTTYMRDAGYYCTNNWKTDYNFPIPEGTWDESSHKAHWRNRSDPQQPFFAVFNFTTTHEGKFKFRDKRFDELVKDVKPEHRVDPSSVKPPPYFPDTAVTRRDWAHQYDMASQVDVEIGRILKQLKEDGLASNTIVFSYSDHGVGLPRSKRWLYDAGLHVPFVVRWPGVIPAGSKNEELVSLMDLAPTVLSITGLDVPDYMQGRIFMGPEKQPEPKYLFATRDRIDEAVDMSRSVRDRRFKYIKNFMPEVAYAQPTVYPDENPTMREMRAMLEDGKLTGPATLLFAPTKPVEELYDTVTDPYEIKNLAGDPAYQERLATMRSVLTEWQEKINDKGRQPEPADEARRAAKKRGRK